MTPGMSADPRIIWALAEMHRRLEQNVAVSELASSVNLSTSRFTHIFTDDVGESPLRYLRRIRLERARDLLETTFLSVKQVMARVGFNDASHFTRDFRHVYGASPRAWRSRAARPPPRALALVVKG